MAVATMMVIAAVTMYLRAADVHTPVPLEVTLQTPQALEGSDDWSGARLQSMLADFDARAVCRKELAGSPAPFCRDLLATAYVGPRLLVLAADSNRANVGAPHLFAISLHEISYGQFRRYCAHSAARCRTQLGPRDDDAAVNVTWDEAQQYVQWLSDMSGQTYRLPTDLESRQAAAAGKKSGWRVGRTREWTQNQPSPASGPNTNDTRSFRALRELH